MHLKWAGADEGCHALSRAPAQRRMWSGPPTVKPITVLVLCRDSMGLESLASFSSTLHRFQETFAVVPCEPPHPCDQSSSCNEVLMNSKTGLSLITVHLALSAIANDLHYPRVSDSLCPRGTQRRSALANHSGIGHLDPPLWLSSCNTAAKTQPILGLGVELQGTQRQTQRDPTGSRKAFAGQRSHWMTRSVLSICFSTELSNLKRRPETDGGG
jgi:hypothetical protein